MTVPQGALQRALFVAVPLALVVLIVVTPSLLGRKSPQATDIPFFLAEVTGRAWNGSVNESVLLYVRSALGVPLYEYLAINVTGLGMAGNLTTDCGGTLVRGGGNWSCGETFVPSLWLKLPAVDAQVVNVSALGAREAARFWFNATIEFVWAEPTWILRVRSDDATSSQDFREVFSVSMRLEARP